VRAARDAGLLVVGTGHNLLVQRALLGSVSQYCVLRRSSSTPAVEGAACRSGQSSLASDHDR
jgi:hypothetical protein